MATAESTHIANLPTLTDLLQQGRMGAVAKDLVRRNIRRMEGKSVLVEVEGGKPGADAQYEMIPLAEIRAEGGSAEGKMAVQLDQNLKDVEQGVALPQKDYGLSLSEEQTAAMTERLRVEAYQWPRLVAPPLKRSGHVVMDVCAAEGEIQRMTVPKSHSKQGYHDARKVNWGDLFPHEPKGKVLTRHRGIRHLISPTAITRPKSLGPAEPVANEDELQAYDQEDEATLKDLTDWGVVFNLGGGVTSEKIQEKVKANKVRDRDNKNRERKGKFPGKEIEGKGKSKKSAEQVGKFGKQMKERSKVYHNLWQFDPEGVSTRMPRAGFEGAQAEKAKMEKEKSKRPVSSFATILQQLEAKDTGRRSFSTMARQPLGLGITGRSLMPRRSMSVRPREQSSSSGEHTSGSKTYVMATNSMRRSNSSQSHHRRIEQDESCQISNYGTYRLRLSNRDDMRSKRYRHGAGRRLNLSGRPRTQFHHAHHSRRDDPPLQSGDKRRHYRFHLCRLTLRLLRGFCRTGCAERDPTG